MNRRLLFVLPLICLGLNGAEKELQLADGRVLRGELMGEQDGQLLLALKVDQLTANVRVAKSEVLSVKDALPLAGVVGEVVKAPEMVVAAKAEDGDFARVRSLIAKAQREATEDQAPIRRLDDGYPYPVWQHWPWIFTIDGPTWGGGYQGHGYWGGHGHGHGHGGPKPVPH